MAAWQDDLLVPDGPQMLEVTAAAQQLLVDGTGAVGILLAVVAQVEDLVEQRLLAAGLVHLAAHLQLPVRAELHVAQLGTAVELREVAPAVLEPVAAAAEFGLQRELGGGEPVDDEGRVRDVLLLRPQEEVPPPRLERNLAGAAHDRRVEGGGEGSVSGPFDGRHPLVEAAAGLEDQLGADEPGLVRPLTTIRPSRSETSVITARRARPMIFR